MKYHITRHEKEQFELMFRNYHGYDLLPHHDYGLREFENELGEWELFVIDQNRVYSIAIFEDYLICLYLENKDYFNEED